MNDERIRELRWALAYLEEHPTKPRCRCRGSCARCREWDAQAAKLRPGLEEVLGVLESERAAQAKAVLDACAAAEERERVRTMSQLTIGQLLEDLEGIRVIYGEDLVVKVRDPDGEVMSAGSAVDSYRGFYEQCAVSCSNSWRTEEDTTVGRLIEHLRSSLEEVHTGYKGGDYRFTVRTPVWMSNYGDASGWEAVEVACESDAAVIKTRRWDQ